MPVPRRNRTESSHSPGRAVLWATEPPPTAKTTTTRTTSFFIRPRSKRTDRRLLIARNYCPRVNGLTNGQLQEGIYFKHRRAPPGFFTLLLLGPTPGATATDVAHLLELLWKRYRSLKRGKVEDLGKARVPGGELQILLGLGALPLTSPVVHERSRPPGVDASVVQPAAPGRRRAGQPGRRDLLRGGCDRESRRRRDRVPVHRRHSARRRAGRGGDVEAAAEADLPGALDSGRVRRHKARRRP